MSVRLEQLSEDLGPDVSQQVLNVLPDEGWGMAESKINMLQIKWKKRCKYLFIRSQ